MLGRREKIMNQDSKDQTTENVEGIEDTTSSDSKSEREISFSRRALIQAGWAVPTVLMFNFPDDASAVTIHTDIPGPPHADTFGHLDEV